MQLQTSMDQTQDVDAVKFYHNLSNLLRTNDFGNEENTIMGGDFNCP